MLAEVEHHLALGDSGDSLARKITMTSDGPREPLSEQNEDGSSKGSNKTSRDFLTAWGRAFTWRYFLESGRKAHRYSKWPHSNVPESRPEVESGRAPNRRDSGPLPRFTDRG